MADLQEIVDDLEAEIRRPISVEDRRWRLLAHSVQPLFKENLALGGFAAPWIHPSPAVYDPETWYWQNPESHLS